MSEEKNGGQLFVKSLCLKFLLEMPSQTRSPDGDDLIGVFLSWAIQNIQAGYPRKQEFHIRYNKQTTTIIFCKCYVHVLYSLCFCLSRGDNYPLFEVISDRVGNSDYFEKIKT